MKFNFSDTKGQSVQFFFEDDNQHPYFSARLGEVFPALEDDTFYVGLGKRKAFNEDRLARAVYKLGKRLYSKKYATLSFPTNPFDLEDEDYVLIVAEALLQSTYRFDYYKEDRPEHGVEHVNFPSAYQGYQEALIETQSVFEAQVITRNLVNIRNNIMTPRKIADEAVRVLENTAVQVKVYDEEEIRGLGLTAFLDVAKGSDEPPRLVVMEYLQGGEEKPLVYAGKGVAYDSGGYTIKTRSGMKTMYCDMAGAATVIGAMKAIADNQLSVNAVGVIGLLENLISGGAYKPGDVITARNGKKIDVDNTDAEGRILLADVVNYATDIYDAEIIVDLATLTGAVLGALGETYTGALTNDEEAYQAVEEAAKASHEKVWLLPNDDHFRTYIKSDVADLVNSGGPLAGTITAGQFIEAFIEKDTPWVHLDIAGTAYLSSPQGLYEKGATGVHVKTLYQLAKNHSK